MILPIYSASTDQSLCNGKDHEDMEQVKAR